MRLDWIDRSAAGLSGLCVLHCALSAAALVALAPLAPMLRHDVHIWGFGLAAPLALMALGLGARAHRRLGALALGMGGLATMAAGLFVAHGGVGELALSAGGAALVAIAHLLNLRWHRSV